MMAGYLLLVLTPTRDTREKCATRTPLIAQP